MTANDQISRQQENSLWLKRLRNHLALYRPCARLQMGNGTNILSKQVYNIKIFPINIPFVHKIYNSHVYLYT